MAERSTIFTQLLEEKPALVADGAMGTALFEGGLRPEGSEVGEERMVRAKPLRTPGARRGFGGCACSAMELWGRLARPTELGS